jgi:hypothetical protein
MDYTLWAIAAIIGAPILFPRVFFRAPQANNDGEDSSRTPKVLFFDVTKKHENPYLDQPTGVGFYDGDEEEYFNIDNIHDNEAFEEICNALAAHLPPEGSDLYLVTYDDECKVACLKSVFSEFFKDHDVEPKIIDLKQLFYYTHPAVPKIEYEGLVEYYKVPCLDKPVVEYIALFDQLIRDFDPNFHDNIEERFVALYEQLET